MEELQCPVSHQMYNLDDRMPRLLPDCGHTISTSALKEGLEAAEAAGKPFVCPECETECSFKKPADEFPKNFALIKMLEAKKKEEESKTQSLCPIYGRPLELICLDHLCRICTSCALFGEHKGCNFS